MRVFQNVDVEAHVWPNLVNPKTKRTLELRPGERVSLDLPEDFFDAHLAPLAMPKPQKLQAAKADKEEK